jgi:antitoxin YefM
MEAIYRLRAGELNENFFKILKETFSEKEIVVTIEEIRDETAYLLSNEANKKHLLGAIEDMKNGKGVHIMTPEEMESMIK